MSHLKQISHITIQPLLIGLCVLLSLQLSASNKPVSELEWALQQAGNNRASLEMVLKHYAGDKEKYQAACFLIKNMPYHHINSKLEYHDPKVDFFCRKVDSVFYAMIKGKTSAQTSGAEFKEQMKTTEENYREKIESYPFRQPIVTKTPLPDIQTIDGKFLIRQIDNAFEKRDKIKFTRQLSFQDFCSYILPYRVFGDYPVMQDNKNFFDKFSKYIKPEKITCVTEAVERYNQTVSNLRRFMGKYPFQSKIGFDELFFNNSTDCVDIAHYGASVLRACGIPTAVEFNMAYKIWSGRHFHVVVPDSLGRWCTFSPESGLPKYRDQKFREALNIYRIHFELQRNSPACLKARQEKIPELFSDPCIEDVTSNIMDVFSLRMPFDKSTGNKLAWLVSFQSQGGLIPVTWGEINHSKKEVYFKNVVPDNLYFPMYYTAENKFVSFGDPFWIKSDTTAKEKYSIAHFNTQSGATLTVDLLRKFPRKPNMLHLAESLVGAVVLASDNSDFSNADTLSRITSVPEPYWQELNLKNTKAYQYYRIQSPKGFPLPIGELEFLTDAKYNYSNTIAATSLPVLSAVQGQNEDTTVVRILDEPLEISKIRSQYDGNVETAPEVDSTITFHPKQPQIVTRIRFIPKNEDNGIQPGCKYSLSVWNGNEWQILLVCEAKSQYIHVENMGIGKLYWLRNITKGKEELPFVIDENGKQQFVHEDLLKILQP